MGQGRWPVIIGAGTLACYRCLSASMHHVACTEKIGVDLINLPVVYGRFSQGKGVGRCGGGGAMCGGYGNSFGMLSKEPRSVPPQFDCSSVGLLETDSSALGKAILVVNMYCVLAIPPQQASLPHYAVL